MEILGLIFAFILFLMILNKGYLATLKPLSLIIVITFSLVVGYALVSVIGFIFGSALIAGIVLIVISLLICFLK